MSTKTNLKPLPAGPKGSLISGCTEEFKTDPLGFLERCQKEYGNVVPFRIGIYPALLVNEPDLIQSILVDEAAHFTKDAALKNNRQFFGNGLLSSEGEYWKQQRKLTAPAFSPKRLEAYSKIMVSHTLQMLNRWQDKQEVEIQHEMMNLALSIAIKTLFDAELDQDNKELEDALTNAQKYLAERMADPLVLMFPEWVPFPTNIHLHQAIEKVDKVVFQLINERRGKTEGRIDLLSTLLSAHTDTDNEINATHMPDNQIRDEIFTMFFAGHETTALSLTWALYFLSLHPSIEENLRQEVVAVLQGRSATIGDYALLPYVEKVLKESLRLRPPVWAIGREAINNCVIGDYAIEKGTSIIMSQWIMHHDERYYKDAHLFNPERWTSEFTESLPKFAYFPFGGGPRICIGNGFAMLEAVLVLATIIQKYRVELMPDHPVEIMPAVTLRPAHGIKMTLHKRQ